MKLISGFLTFVCLILVVHGLSQNDTSIQEIVDLTGHFAASLGSDGKNSVAFDFNNEERMNWHYIPRERKGVPLERLTPAQRKLAHGLLSTLLSNRGLREVEQIMYLEQILFESSGGNPIRNADAYFFSIFGKPALKSTWGLRFEGHHLSLNLTLREGRLASSSPAFFGANPAIVPDGPHKGLRVLATEEDLARRLAKSFSNALGEKILLSEKAPRDIVTGASREVDLDHPSGVSWSQMTSSQTDLLSELIRHYAERFRPEFAEENLSRLKEQGLEEIHFAWAGGLESGTPHYYRVHGPSFVIEYDNSQRSANHIHTVWRDIDNDFGRDLLKEHYDHSH